MTTFRFLAPTIVDMFCALDRKYFMPLAPVYHAPMSAEDMHINFEHYIEIKILEPVSKSCCRNEFYFKIIKRILIFKLNVITQAVRWGGRASLSFGKNAHRLLRSGTCCSMPVETIRLILGCESVKIDVTVEGAEWSLVICSLISSVTAGAFCLPHS